MAGGWEVEVGREIKEGVCGVAGEKSSGCEKNK